LEKSSFSLFETLLALVIVSILATGFTQFSHHTDTNTKTKATSSIKHEYYGFKLYNNDIIFLKNSNDIIKTSYTQTALNIYSYAFLHPLASPKRFKVFK
jgi:hypothetical protein